MEMIFDVSNSHHNSRQFQVNLDMLLVNIGRLNGYLNTVGVSQIQKEAKTVTMMLLMMSLAMLLVKVILVWLSDSKANALNGRK